MNEYRNQALKKLQEGAKNGKYDRYAQRMKELVLEKLTSFAEQNEEFAQAIVQGGSFEDCMKTVAKNCGDYMPDEYAYQRAVAFFFPGATVKMQLTIDLIGDAAKDYTPKHASEGKGSGIVLDFKSFL